MSTYVFVAIFGVHRFIGCKVEMFAANRDALPLEADEVHFDAMLGSVIGRVMGKGVGIEIRPQFAIGAQQQILVESSGDAG